MAARLVACPSCSQHIKLDESHCHHCGARLRADGGMIGRTAGAMLLGLSMTACPGDDSSSDSGASNSDSDTMGMTGGTTGGSVSASMSGSADDSTTFIGEPEYGVGDTTFAETTDGGSDSTSVSAGDSSSSSSGSAESTTDTTGDMTSSTSFNSGEPEYGVPLTTGGIEPDYGVPFTTGGVEPDYGVPEPAPE